MNNGHIDRDTVAEIEDVVNLDIGDGSDYEPRGGAGEKARPGVVSGTPTRALTIGAAILLLFLLTGTVAWLFGSQTKEGDGQTGAPVIGLRVGALAPDFTLTDADTDKAVSLSSLRGRPVWINFWASWCQACWLEMPDMQKAYDQYKDKGLVILGVNNRESKKDINIFTHYYGYNWTFLQDPTGD